MSQEQEFVKGEIYKCPNCGEWTSTYDRFCGNCGVVLPLPPTVAGLEAQLDIDDIPEIARGNSHKIQKEDKNKFCTRCGRKL